MIIINADDYGRNKIATDNIIACFQQNLITSTSAMVYMEDSERAAAIALDQKIDVGLHLNLTEAFDGNVNSAEIKKYNLDISSYFTGNKFRQVIYNPLITKKLKRLFYSQYREFIRLYKKKPTHINGHHHMHLSVNMLFSNIIPKGVKLRKNFSFSAHEKSKVNRLYRRLIDLHLRRYYRTTDYFFSICPFGFEDRLDRIFRLACKSIVELEVHPEISLEYKFLRGEKFSKLVAVSEVGTYSDMI